MSPHRSDPWDPVGRRLRPCLTGRPTRTAGSAAGVRQLIDGHRPALYPQQRFRRVHPDVRCVVHAFLRRGRSQRRIQLVFHRVVLALRLLVARRFQRDADVLRSALYDGTTGAADHALVATAAGRRHTRSTFQDLQWERMRMVNN